MLFRSKKRLSQPEENADSIDKAQSMSACVCETSAVGQGFADCEGYVEIGDSVGSERANESVSTHA